MMYEDEIRNLKELAKTEPKQQRDLGVAIGLLKFCAKQKISRKDRVWELPECQQDFGCYILQECNKIG